jgi:hypothetical protein
MWGDQAASGDCLAVLGWLEQIAKAVPERAVVDREDVGEASAGERTGQPTFWLRRRSVRRQRSATLCRDPCRTIDPCFNQAQDPRHLRTPSQQPIGQSYRLRPHPPTFWTLPRAIVSFARFSEPRTVFWINSRR